jgi:hypothetical protein
MARALDGCDGKCSSVHGTTSPLLTALRPGARALDLEADPVEASRLAGDSVAARLGGRLLPERGRRKPAASPPGGRRGIARLRRGTCTCWRRDASHCGEIVREIREQFGSAAGNREVMPENAPAFAR